MAVRSQIRCYTLLLLEQFRRLPVLFSTILLGFVPHLVIDLYLVFCHLDVFLNDTDFLLLFRPLKTEVSIVTPLGMSIVIRSSRDSFRVRSGAHLGACPRRL